MAEQPAGTDVASVSELDQLAERTRDAPPVSTRALHDDVNRAVGLYLKEQDTGLPAAVDHQHYLEALLGSQHADLIRDAQRSYRAGVAQCAPDRPEGTPHARADPVVMHIGQFVHTATDLRIGGAGVDFAFSRTYRNQAFYTGPLGTNWDHAYNLWLREEGESLVRSSGELREDRYVRHAHFDYWVPPPGYSDVITRAANSFVLETPGGTRFRYERTAQGTLHRVAEVVTKAGHWLRFDYNVDGRLAAVYVNHAERVVTFEYDEHRRIEAVVAYPVHYDKRSGRRRVARRWEYVYDDFGDLVAVVSPATDEHPAGVVTRYAYSSPYSSGEAMHNLVAITGPDGREFVENQYGSVRGLVDHNRVVRQRQGAGEHLFRYEDLLGEGTDLPAHARPVRRTTHVLPNGQDVVYVYNAFGGVLLKTERVRDGCGLRTLVWRHAYDDDGTLVATLSPEGSLTQFLHGRHDFYERPAAAGDRSLAEHEDPRLSRNERLRFGNVLASVRRGQRLDLDQLALNRGLWGDVFPSVYAVRPQDAVVKYTYDGASNRVATESDARFTESPDPRHAERPAYARHLSRYVYAAATGLVERFLPPETSYPSPLPGGDTGPGPAEQRYEYDAQHRLLRVTGPEGSITEYAYHPDAGPDRVKAGYLLSETRAAGHLDLTTTFEINEAGLVTATTNPAGAVEQFVTDELDRTVEHRAHGPGHVTRFRFDGNGRLVRRTRDTLGADGTPLAGGAQVATFAYDALEHLIRETLGGTNLDAHAVTEHRHDACGRRVRTVLPRGNDVRYGYDERMLRTVTSRGACGPDAATERTAYDGDGRIVRVADPNGNATVTRYDALGHATVREDALGGLTITDYDVLDNPVVVRRFGRAGGGHALLSRRAFEYDERGGRIRERAFAFPSPIATAAPEQAPDAEFTVELAAGNVGVHVAETFFDRNRRVVRVVNERGFTAETVWDAADRRVVERDAAGNETRITYDAAGNPVRVDRYEFVPGAQPRTEVFSTLAEFDTLGRRTATVDPLGNRTRFAYDSLDRLERTVDPLGNVTLNSYDVHGRLVRESRELTTTGRGGGAPAGTVVTAFEHDANGNLVAVRPPTGAALHFVHDDLDRQVEARYDGQPAHDVRGYDPAGNLVSFRDGAGVETATRFDALNRPVRTEFGPAGALPAGAASFEEFAYDLLGRRVREANDWCDVRSRVDSLGGVWREDVMLATAGAPAGPLRLERVHDALGNVVALTLPSGRQVGRDYDPLARLEAVRNVQLGAGYPGAPGTPPLHDVARLSYAGLRLTSVRYGNGASCALSYDAAGRLLEVTHRDAGGVDLLRLQRLADAAGNTVLEWEQAAGGQPDARRLGYDSAYRLTGSAAAQAAALDPALHAPSPVAPAAAQLTGQEALDRAVAGAVVAGGGREWDYDASGNRTAERDGAAQVAYVPNPLSQYTSRDGVAMSYDGRGALSDDGAQAYGYDGRGQLVMVTDAAGAPVLELRRDARGRPCAIIDANDTTHLVHDGGDVVEEYAGGALSAQYVIGGGLDQRFQVAAGGEENWYHADHVGSTRLLTDGAGAAAAGGAWSYDEYGTPTAAGGHANPYLFGGKRSLGAVGHYDSRARTYAPKLGRFLERDPAGLADGPNPYTYAANNPRTFVDPLGTEKQQIEFDATAVEATGTTATLIGTAAAAARHAWRNGDHELARYYESEVGRLAAELNREGQRGMAKFAAASYLVAGAAAVGGYVGGAAAASSAATAGWGMLETSLFVGAMSGAWGSASEQLMLMALGNRTTPGEFATNVGIGGATGLLLGGLAAWKSYSDFPLNVKDPGGKAGWNRIVEAEVAGTITRPRGPRPNLDDYLDRKPGFDRAHLIAYILGGAPDDLFYSSPRINRSHMAVYEGKAVKEAQGGVAWVVLERGGGRFSLDWRAYNAVGESIRLQVPDVTATPPRLAPQMKAQGIKLEFKHE